MTLQIVEPKAYRTACEDARKKGKTVGLVPTMGALHEGHLSLIHEAKKLADFVVATIFVNPAQFAENEDLSKYPRTLQSDFKMLESLNVDLVFTPSADSLYPSGFQTFVEVTNLTRTLEGKFRPSHFKGVTTIVAKFLNLTGPCISVFGKKDYQQYKVIERMVQDLHLPTQVMGTPIVRDADGLALSSRNQYLTANERVRALSLFRSIQLAKEAFRQGERNSKTLEKIVHQELKGHVDRIDYASLIHPDSLLPYREDDDLHPLLVIAAHVGATRLIDNASLYP